MTSFASAGLYPVMKVTPPEDATQVPPVGTVSSYQPVLVLAQTAGLVVNSSISASIQLSCNSNDTARINCASYSTTVPYSHALLSFPGAPGWSFATIPGLPARTLVVQKPSCIGYLRSCFVSLTLSSTVSYSINGVPTGPVSYQVQQSISSQTTIPPIVGAFVSQDLADSIVMRETYGLSPSGWVAGPNDQMSLIFFSFSSNGVHSLSGYYSVNGGTANKLSGTEDEIQSRLDGALQKLNSTITNVNNAISASGFSGYSFQLLHEPISVQDATIPQEPLGSYITFNASSSDNRGNNGTSPEGLYYVVNKQASTKVLVVDPHVKLWLLLQNLNTYANLAKSNFGYQLPAALQGSDNLLLQVSQLLKNFESGQFHYWNLFGQSYNVVISDPDSNAANLLQSFAPNVILLSDLSLGYQSQQGTPSQFFDWDLNDVKDGNGQTILSDVISYTQKHHSGLIGTAGTLSDWEVGCPPGQTKVGSTGNVGKQVSDANPLQEQTLSPMFGMPLLPIFEYARDQAAEGSGSACPAIGSIPLLVPVVPWDGTLNGPSLFPSSIINPNRNIMTDLPSNLNLKMPFYQPQYNAINTIGWQLSLPVVLAGAAWNAANASRSQATQLEQNLVSLSRNITPTSDPSTKYLDCALNQGLSALYKSLASATLNSSGINVNLKIPCAGASYSRFLSVPISQLAGMTPVQIGALSPNYVAGIVTYDKYYDSDGYRSVYFSFPLESSNQTQATTLLSNAIGWSLSWKYDNTLKTLGGLVVSGATSQIFRSAVNGKNITSSPILTNEQGNATVSFTAASSGSYNIIVVSPFFSNATLVPSSNAKLTGQKYLGNGVTTFNIDALSAGRVDLSLTADTASSLTPMYVQVNQPPITSTASSTTRTTTISATSSTSTQTRSAVSSTATTSSTTTTPILGLSNTTLVAVIAVSVVLISLGVFFARRRK